MLRPNLILTVIATLAVSACEYPMTFKAPLSAASEVPPNNSPGTGEATAVVNSSTKTLTYTVTYKDLTGAPTAAHFHGPAGPGENAPVMVPMQVSPSPVKGGANLTPSQLAAFQSGKVYVNVHTRDHKDGEIRGQLQRVQ